MNHDTHSGQLGASTLPDLLQQLQATKATGTLTLQHNGQEKSIYLKDGQIVFASSSVPEDRLGNVLVAAGKLTREQMEAALKLRAAANKRFGAIVVELGFMSPRELFEGLKLQVREIIFGLFQWNEGRYRFTPGALPGQIIPLVLDPIPLITEIIQRLQQDLERKR